MKRLWPIFLALFCWLLVLTVPLSRQNTVAAWVNLPQLSFDASPKTALGFKRHISEDEQQWLDRFPRDKPMQIFLANLWASDGYIQLNELAKRYPNDALFIALQLQNEMADFDSRVARVDGPVSNPTRLIKAPPASKNPAPDWEGFIALARRGQALEPNNTYFDWMLLYGLYATNQDEEAYKALQRASTKTGYDSHLRELVLNNFAVTKKVYGSPIRTDRMMLMASTNWNSYPLRRVANWTMDTAILQREKGQHERALTNSYNMLRVSRVLRLNGYTASESTIGVRCEDTCLNNSVRSNPANGHRSGGDEDPIRLWNYAYEQIRPKIGDFATAEFKEEREWEDKYVGVYNGSWLSDNSLPTSLINNLSESQAILLKTLPVTLILCTFFGLLAWRVRSGDAENLLDWEGANHGLRIVLLLMTLLQLLTVRTIVGQPPQPFLEVVPVWFVYGVPLLVACVGLWRAHRWQRDLEGPAPTLNERFQKLSPNLDEGLPGSGFGWFLGVAVQWSFWIILTYLLYAFCQKFRQDPNYFANTNTVALGLLVLVIGFLLATFLFGWYNRPRRSETLRRSFRTIHQATAGYLVAASVIYAVVTFTGLPQSLDFERQWQKKFETGEAKFFRAQVEEYFAHYRATHPYSFSGKGS